MHCHFTRPEWAAGGGDRLGVVRFGPRSEPPTTFGGTAELAVHTTESPGSGFAEVWSTGRPVDAGVHNGLAYGHDGRYLFCAGRIPPLTRYSEAVRDTYLEALDLVDRLGYRRPFRIWNFVAGINRPNGEGLEVYRDFCRGRAEAFDRLPAGSWQLPAATAVGAYSGGIAFYLLARRHDGHLPVENRRQISAYRYGPRYGPRSPSFARAAVLSPAGPDARCFVSGTASILRSETVHAGDIEAQCRTTLANIAHLLSPENLAGQGYPGSKPVRLRAVKAYVRRPADLPTVRRACAAEFGPDTEVAYLTLDICRADLLVEIEGVAY